MATTLSDLLDRLALSDLVHAYAQRVDARDAAGVAALFTDNGVLEIHAEEGHDTVTARHLGRAQIEAAIAAMAYRATSHSIGNHLAVLEGDRATGETRCVAHHVSGPAGAELDRVWHLRYFDRYVREGGGWLIDERVLAVDIVLRQPLRIG